jgi:hypothetical protein
MLLNTALFAKDSKGAAMEAYQTSVRTYRFSVEPPRPAYVYAPPQAITAAISRSSSNGSGVTAAWLATPQVVATASSSSSSHGGGVASAWLATPQVITAASSSFVVVHPVVLLDENGTVPSSSSSSSGIQPFFFLKSGLNVETKFSRPIYWLLRMLGLQTCVLGTPRVLVTDCRGRKIGRLELHHFQRRSRKNPERERLSRQFQGRDL